MGHRKRKEGLEIHKPRAGIVMPPHAKRLFAEIAFEVGSQSSSGGKKQEGDRVH